ncbi:MAG: phenylalanine--tRNA ligase subunit beta [Bdellovibrionota bacterium]
MYISINWIKDFVDLDGLDIDKLIQKFSLSTAEVENEIFYKGSDIKGVVVGEIKEVREHLENKKYHVLKVDIGEKDLIDVVCGAPNVRVNMKTAFAKVGGKIGSIDIEPKDFQGVMSSGMCCSEKELGISDNNSRIMELPLNLKNGTDLKEIFDIDDIIFEIDNKSLTNRPDLWGHYGIAREFSVLSGRPLKEMKVANLKKYDRLPKVDLKIMDDDCLRYASIKFENVNVKVSPVNIKIRLYYCGMRAINFLTDLTNYLMLEMGQPMHAFDSRKIDKIRIKKFDKPFKFKTLDGVERNIDTQTLMICSDDTPVAIAGIMGGFDSEIATDTSSFTLESACFDAPSVRKSATRLNHRTDASQRYEKTLDPEMTTLAVARLVELLTSIDKNVKVVSALTDEYKRSYERKTISFDKAYVDRYTGIGDAITNERIEKTLKSLGFEVKRKGDNFSVKVPSWRATKDVTMKVDLVEEITRIYGYDNFTPQPLESSLYPVNIERKKLVEEQIKDILVKRFLLHEVHSYIWAYYDECKNLGIEIEDNIEISDSINPNIKTIRRSIIPTSLCQVSNNTFFASDFGIFEIGSVVNGLNKDNLCDEHKMLAITLFSKTKSTEELFFNLRDMMFVIGLEVVRKDITLKPRVATRSFEHPKNLNTIICDNVELGVIGVVHPSVGKNIDKKASIIFLEIDVFTLSSIEKEELVYDEISKYPSVEVDLNFVSNTYDVIGKTIDEINSSLITKVKVIDIYNENDTKAITIRLTFSCLDRTLTREEVQEVVDKIVDSLARKGVPLK